MGRALRLAPAAVSLAPTAAQAQERYRVTIAARVCPTYQAITAYLRRDDIQESLQILGPNSMYGGGDSIDPDVEARGQPSPALGRRGELTQQ